MQAADACPQLITITELDNMVLFYILYAGDSLFVKERIESAQIHPMILYGDCGTSDALHVKQELLNFFANASSQRMNNGSVISEFNLTAAQNVVEDAYAPHHLTLLMADFAIVVASLHKSLAYVRSIVFQGHQFHKRNDAATPVTFVFIDAVLRVSRIL
jgi:hypothetical protein